jgi:hypothetical protein
VTTRLVKTSLKDCTERLNLLKSLKVVAKNWYTIRAHKIIIVKGLKEESS